MSDLTMHFTQPIEVNLRMTDTVRAETAVAIAAEFAEWLERNGFDIDPSVVGGERRTDDRSYAKLARDFVAQWKAQS